MPEICYTAAQVKFVKTSIVLMMGLSIFQALTIRRMAKEFAQGQHRFNNLRDGANYLLNILEENDISLTEFDVIALTDIVEQS